MKKTLLAEIENACTQQKVIQILHDIYELLDKRLPLLSVLCPTALSPEERKEVVRPIESYTENELVTIKEAAHLLGVSRWKVDNMRKKKQLTTLDRGGQIRLIRKEVDDAKIWYSIPKGKV